jgi:hypothetical protein
MSDISTLPVAPDLSLRTVAFARLSQGRMVARGTFDSVNYVRAGGWLDGSRGAAVLEPEPGTGFASFGALHVTAPRTTGHVSGQRATASGGVHFDAARGDVAMTERAEYDGAAGSLRIDTPVDAQGPGYRVHGNGLLARTDGSSIALLGGVRGSLQMEAQR